MDVSKIVFESFVSLIDARLRNREKKLNNNNLKKPVQFISVLLPCVIKEWLKGMKFVASYTNVGNCSHNGFCPRLRPGPINAESTAISCSGCSFSDDSLFLSSSSTFDKD